MSIKLCPLKQLLTELFLDLMKFVSIQVFSSIKHWMKYHFEIWKAYHFVVSSLPCFCNSCYCFRLTFLLLQFLCTVTECLLTMIFGCCFIAYTVVSILLTVNITDIWQKDHCKVVVEAQWKVLWLFNFCVFSGCFVMLTRVSSIPPWGNKSICDLCCTPLAEAFIEDKTLCFHSL